MTTVRITLLAPTEEEIEAARLELANAFGDRFWIETTRDGRFGDVLSDGRLIVPTPAPRVLPAPVTGPAPDTRPKRHRRRKAGA